MTDSAANGRRVDANPEKRFFISMLVKDIELFPAVVDLVDNSVDAARANASNGDLSPFSVDLEATPSRFAIKDNCGGLEAHIARYYAFRFGRGEDFPALESSVGQFGIGMKRALFKLGGSFRVESIAENSRFALAVNVEEWARNSDPDWSFEFEYVDYDRGGGISERGTWITVDDIHPSVSADFGDSKVIGKLRREIAVKHEPALTSGLTITVNGRSLEAHVPRLLASTAIMPINTTFTIPVGTDSVSVRIVAGIATARERDDRSDDDASQFTEMTDAGWYIYCNDRLVLAADRSDLTGWGSAGAAYHPQYRRFRGYCFMSAVDSSLLPWNTTKTGLDQDSPVFRRVQQELFRALQQVQAVINRAKTERQTRDSDEQQINAALEQSAEVRVAALPPSRDFVAPVLAARNPTPPHVVNVQYKVPRRDMDRVMDALDVDSASRAGQLTFEYYIQAELE